LRSCHACIGVRPHRVAQAAAVASGERGEGDLHERRARGGRGDGVEVDAGQLREQAEREHAGRAPLVVGGADGREALDVLGRAQAGGDRALHVGDGRVALEVDV
jgi:hypothetical protein